MMEGTGLTRRSLLKASSGVFIIGKLAGCLGDEEPTNANENGNGGPGEIDLDEWFDNTPNYDEIHDMRGQNPVEVENGMNPEYGRFVFEPAAIQIDNGTTVLWEWVDNDSHSVTSTDTVFDSGTTAGRGTTFEHTFDGPTGMYAYYCRPHRAIGQKGVVIVE